MPGENNNAGQVCIDYLLVHETRKEDLVKITAAIQHFYSEIPVTVGGIINKKHFDRLMKLLQNGNIIFAEIKRDERYISPT